MCPLRKCVPPKHIFSSIMFPLKNKNMSTDNDPTEEPSEPPVATVAIAPLARDGEIVGRCADNNGRSCESHSCCGTQLKPNDVVTFKSCVVTVDGLQQQALKDVLVLDGTESCTVGFLSRDVVTRMKDKLVDQFAQVIELYEGHENATMRRKSHRNCGVASYRLFRDIQKQE